MFAQLTGFVWWPDMHKGVAAVHTWCNDCAGRNRTADPSAYLRAGKMPLPFTRISWDVLVVSPPGAWGGNGDQLSLCASSPSIPRYFHITSSWPRRSYLMILDAGVVPNRARSDRGSAFKNTVYMELSNLLGLTPNFGWRSIVAATVGSSVSTEKLSGLSQPMPELQSLNVWTTGLSGSPCWLITCAIVRWRGISALRCMRWAMGSTARPLYVPS